MARYSRMCKTSTVYTWHHWAARSNELHGHRDVDKGIAMDRCQITFCLDIDGLALAITICPCSRVHVVASTKPGVASTSSGCRCLNRAGTKDRQYQHAAKWSDSVCWPKHTAEARTASASRDGATVLQYRVQRFHWLRGISMKS